MEEVVVEDPAVEALEIQVLVMDINLEVEDQVQEMMLWVAMVEFGAEVVVVTHAMK